MSFAKLIRNIKKVQGFDIVKESLDIIKQNQYYLIGLLRLQLQKGKYPDGENVTLFGKDEYAPSTIYKKLHTPGLSALGRETGFITNYMFGDFYDKMTLVIRGQEFIITSDVDYMDAIISRSGSEIMQLSDEHLKEFRDEILIPELKRRLNNGL